MLVRLRGGTSVKLEPYISVNFTGTDGNGTATFDFDYASFEYEIMSQWKDDEKNGEKLAELTAVELTLNFEQPAAEGLSNGDSVTATMVYDEDKAKEAGYSFTDVSKTFKVEGLIEPIEIDPFDESVFGEGKTVSYTLEGISPQISFSLSNGAGYDDPLYNVRYHADAEYSALKNGDAITVTAELINHADQQGYVLTRTETTIPVEGFDAYVTSADQLTEEMLKELGDRALQERQNISYIKIYDGTSASRSMTELPENIHLGDTALLEVGKEGLWFYYPPVILIPVYETMVSPDYYDEATGTNIEKRWENIVSYFTFTEPVLHADNTFSYADYVDFHGAYPDAATADDLFLNDYQDFYDLIEVPLQ